MDKKGFTLIELLAVIVILAIIALIATPIILNVINDARRNAAMDSEYGYIDAIEAQNQLAQLNPEKYTKIESGNVLGLNVNVKGKKPSSGNITIEKGKVTNAVLCFNNYNVEYDGNIAKVNGNCNTSSNELETPTDSVYSPGDLVYYDPVSENTCDSTHTTSATCYKWRIITVDDSQSKDKITIQLEHNLVENDRWSTGNQITSGPDKILSSLATATASWSRVSALNYTYTTTASTGNYGTLTCTSGTCKITENDTAIATNVKARLITAEEVKALTLNAEATDDSNAGTWTQESTIGYGYYISNSSKVIGTNSNVATGETGNTSLSWLFSSDSNTNNGYWTLTIAPTNNSMYAWVLGNDDSDNDKDNMLVNYRVDVSNKLGARPVIEVLKTDLK